MPSLTLKNLPEELLGSLRTIAKEERRSLTAQATYLLERAAQQHIKTREATPTSARETSEISSAEQLQRRKRIREGLAKLDALQPAGTKYALTQERIDEILDDTGYNPFEDGTIARSTK